MSRTFDDRFAQEIKRLYLSLYHDEHAYDYFADMLRRCHEARRPALRALNAQRAEQPDWYRKQDVLGMLMYTQCFGGTLTLSGVPVLYSGDEIGQRNDYTYHDDPFRREDSRYLHRGAFRWSDAQKRTDPESWQGKIYRMIGELTRIRRENRAFDARADVWTFDTGSDHVLGIGRYFEGQKLLTLLNFSDRELEVSLDGREGYANLRSGERESGRVKLPPCGFAWLMTEPDLDIARA